MDVELREVGDTHHHPSLPVPEALYAWSVQHSLKDGTNTNPCRYIQQPRILSQGDHGWACDMQSCQ